MHKPVHQVPENKTNTRELYQIYKQVLTTQKYIKVRTLSKFEEQRKININRATIQN